MDAADEPPLLLYILVFHLESDEPLRGKFTGVAEQVQQTRYANGMAMGDHGANDHSREQTQDEHAVKQQAVGAFCPPMRIGRPHHEVADDLGSAAGRGMDDVGLCSQPVAGGANDATGISPAPCAGRSDGGALLSPVVLYLSSLSIPWLLYQYYCGTTRHACYTATPEKDGAIFSLIGRYGP
jgi:hypothetical protein